MTDYLEELLEGADALMEQMRRLEGRLTGPGPEEPAAPPMPEQRRPERQTAEDSGGEAELPEERMDIFRPNLGRTVEEISNPVGWKENAGTVETEKKSPLESEAEREEPRAAESPALLDQLERLERAAVLEEGGLLRTERPDVRETAGRQGEYPAALVKAGGGSFGWIPEDSAGWSWRSLPDSAQDSSGGELSLAEQTDQAFRRDSRRYDGGFYLY